MFKYKNISTSIIMLSVDGIFKSIKPNQQFESKYFIDNKFLIETSEKPQIKEVKKQVKQ